LIKRPRLAGLWRHHVFQRFWAAQTISLFGTQVTALALPLCAIVLLSATPVQMGVLGAAQVAPYLFFGLPFGAWVDRRRRLPVMIGCDLGRALLLCAVPLAAVVGSLSMELLYVIAFAVGTLTTVYEVAYFAALPSLVGGEELLEGNAKLETTRSLALTAGPSVGGVLVQLLSAPIAILADVLSYLASAALTLRIRGDERARAVEPRRHLLREMAEGVATTMRSPLLRALVAANASFNFGVTAAYTVFLVFATRELGLDAAVIGLILSLGTPGVLIGAVLTPRLSTHLGIGRTMVVAEVIGALGWFVVSIASGPLWLAAAMVALGRALYSFCVPMANVPTLSILQLSTPPRLLARVTATVRIFTRGSVPLGALVGGVVGETLGLRPALAMGGIFLTVSVVILLLSPIRDMRWPAKNGVGSPAEARS
jgi:predicted MFS family arabinose efflux permease